MAEITGSITTFIPSNGATEATPPVDVQAVGTVIIPAAEGGDQDTYKVTIRLHVYSFSDCNTVRQSAPHEWLEVFVPQEKETTTLSIPINQAGFYLATAWLMAQKKPPGGDFGPEVVLDKKVSSFQVGTPADCAPQAFICVGINSPAAGCKAPMPANGAIVEEGWIQLNYMMHYQVVGASSCNKTFHFHGKIDLNGPITTGREYSKNITGLGTGKFALSPRLYLPPGYYTVTGSITVEREDSPNPACNQLQVLGGFSWTFTVKDSSSSPSSQSPSSQSPSSQSPSSQSPSSQSPSSQSPSSQSPSSQSPSSRSPSSQSPSSQSQVYPTSSSSDNHAPDSSSSTNNPEYSSSSEYHNSSGSFQEPDSSSSL